LAIRCIGRWLTGRPKLGQIARRRHAGEMALPHHLHPGARIVAQEFPTAVLAVSLAKRSGHALHALGFLLGEITEKTLVETAARGDAHRQHGEQSDGEHREKKLGGEPRSHGVDE
jgi:hypothetical protein